MNDKVTYRHIRLDTQEVFYVGIGDSRRPYSLNRTKHWHRIVNKVSYRVEIVKENISWDEAVLWEKSEISKIGRLDLGTGPLINLTSGGDGTPGAIRGDEFREKVGNFHRNRKRSLQTVERIKSKRASQVITETHKEKISKSLIGKKRASPSPSKGIPRTEEVRRKISQSKIGHEVSDETRKKISIAHKGHTRQTNPKVLNGTLENFIRENPEMGYRKIGKILGIGKNTVLKYKQMIS